MAREIFAQRRTRVGAVLAATLALFGSVLIPATPAAAADCVLQVQGTGGTGTYVGWSGLKLAVAAIPGCSGSPTGVVINILGDITAQTSDTEISLTPDVAGTLPVSFVGSGGVRVINVAGDAAHPRSFLSDSRDSPASLTFENLVIQNAWKRGSGGAIQSNSANITIRNSSLLSNMAADDSNAGAVYAGGTLAVLDSTISGNKAEDSIGGLYSYGDMTIIRSTVSGNTAGFGMDAYGSHNDGEGGAVYTYDGTVTLTNSTIFQNTAYNDYPSGGIYAANVVLNFSTVVGNLSISDVTRDGNIYLTGSEGSLSGIASVILTAGLGGESCSLDGSTTPFAELLSSISDDASCLPASDDSNKLLTPSELPILATELGDNGTTGRPQTLAPLAGSPVIDFLSGYALEPYLGGLDPSQTLQFACSTGSELLCDGRDFTRPTSNPEGIPYFWAGAVQGYTIGASKARKVDQKVRYTGISALGSGASFTPTLTRTAACTGQITYRLDRSPLDGTTGAYPLGAVPISTNGWQPGEYRLSINAGGSTECRPSSTSVTLAVTSAGTVKLPNTGATSEGGGVAGFLALALALACGWGARRR